jgi:hypothetical protein
LWVTCGVDFTGQFQIAALQSCHTMTKTTKPMHRFATPNHLDITRTSRRPTTAIHQFDPHRFQEVILGVFKRWGLNAIDLEALIHFCLQAFEVSPDNYETMHKTVKAHVLKNFAIHQGSQLRLNEVSMRRITVCHTIEREQE